MTTDKELLTEALTIVKERREMYRALLEKHERLEADYMLLELNYQIVCDKAGEKTEEETG